MAPKLFCSFGSLTWCAFAGSATYSYAWQHWEEQQGPIQFLHSDVVVTRSECAPLDFHHMHVLLHLMLDIARSLQSTPDPTFTWLSPVPALDAAAHPVCRRIAFTSTLVSNSLMSILACNMWTVSLHCTLSRIACNGIGASKQ